MLLNALKWTGQSQCTPKTSFLIKECRVLSEQDARQTWEAKDLEVEGKTKQNKNNRPTSRGFQEAGQSNRHSTGSKVYGLGEQVAISTVRWQGGGGGAVATAGRQRKAKQEPRSMQSPNQGSLSGISRVLATCLGSQAGQRLKRETGGGG